MKTKKIVTYIAITLLAVVVLLLFQLVGMSLGLFDSDYEINKYASDAPVLESDAPRTATATTVAIVSKLGAEALPAVQDACYYLGYQCDTYETLTSDALAADVLFWGDDALDVDTDVPKLVDYSATGKTLVMARLPKVSLLTHSDALCRMLGVKSVDSVATHTTALCLYKGFLLGGDVVYDQIKLTVPWLTLRPGYNVYISGYVDDPADPEARTLPMLWRTHPTNGFVFVCAGDWLTRADGVGFVHAILGQTAQMQLYPVINAQTMMVQNFPYLSTENEELVNRWYHQTSEKLFFNALLPNVTAVFSNLGYPMTCLFSSCMDGQTPDWRIKWDSLKLYIRLIVGRSGEMGISGYEQYGKDYATKLKRDLAELNALARAYGVTVFASNGMPRAEYEPLLAAGQPLEDVRTLVEPLDGDGQALRYAFLNERVLSLPITHDGFVSTDEASLSVRSYETALLATNVSVDMATILYPTDEKDDWALLNKAWSDTLATEWYPFKALDKLCVSDADHRARVYLNLRWSFAEDGDSFRIHIDDYTEPVYFLLRKQDVAVYQCENVSATRLDEDSYLLKITAADAVVNTRYEHRIRVY